jgi:hypothetical protein
MRNEQWALQEGWRVVLEVVIATTVIASVRQIAGGKLPSEAIQ